MSKRRSQDSGRALEARQGNGRGPSLGIRKGAQGLSRHSRENANVRSSENQTFSVGLWLNLILGLRIHHSSVECLRLKP